MYKGRIVLQMPKELLSYAFNLTSLLRKMLPNSQCYVLYDSLKSSCCTDLLGAEHVNYDCLVHFGYACFSSDHRPNHHYVLEDGEHYKK